MGSRGILLALLAGCYGPSINPGSPCTEQGLCPDPLICHAGRCLLAPEDGSPFDTTVVDGVDAAPDPDAAPDAAIDAAVMPDSSTSSMWSAPVALPGTGVNTAASEGDPSITNDRLTLYFVRTVGTDAEIFVASRPTPTSMFGAATAVTALNSTSSESSPEISDDGLVIAFTSNRSGNFEVYYSRFVSNAWTPPMVITELSSAQVDSDVAVSPDRLTALVSRGPTGARKIFRSTRASVLALWGTPVELTDVNVVPDPAAPSLTNGASSIYVHANSVRDLFVTAKAGSTYPPPSLITEINTMAREAGPFVLQGNDYMVFERAGTIYETSR